MDTGSDEYYGLEFDHEHHNVGKEPADIRGMRRLWCAVIMQAVIDARSKPKRDKDLTAKRHAIYWLFENKRDFAAVCALANFDPEYIRGRVQKARYKGLLGANPKVDFESN